MQYITKNSQNTKKQKFFKYYTIIFILAFVLVFSWYFCTRTSFIWEKDGWAQHYKALVYYARYLRQILYGIFYKHQFVIPQWDFSIGEGSDILATLHYYVIGDPFTILSVFVPSSYMYIYYEAIIILRMYLAGIAFSYFCFKTGRTSHYAIMAGSLVYVFCYWATLNAVRHPYFLNPMIYLPLLLTGIEKILKKEKPYLFTISVFLSAISNFYFFYILVLLTIIYVVIRFCILYKNNFKKWWPGLWRITMSSLLGVLMAAIILMPVCYTFLNDTRISTENTYQFIYPVSYYGQLPLLFITGNNIYWLCMGYAAPLVPAIFLLFYKRKKYFLLKTIFITGIIIMLIPFFGQVLNGFSYVTNRWSFAFALVCSYILTLIWPHLISIKLKEFKILAASLTFYFIICITACLIYGTSKKSVCISILIAYTFLIVMMPFKNNTKISGRRRKQKISILLIIINIFCNSYFSNVSNNYILECKKINEIQELTQNETKTVLKVSKLNNINSFFRYSGKELTENANMIAGISSTQYFWSLSNPYAADFRRKLEFRETSAYHYNGYDDRTALMALASVFYYVQPSKKKVFFPYGFESLENISSLDYTVCQNKYALPLGYTYDTYILRNEWEELTSIYKQETLLQGVVLEDYNGKIPKASIKNLSEEKDYKIICKNKNVTIKNNSFTALSDGAKIKFKFKGQKDCETYFSIKGLDLQEELINTELKLESSTGTIKRLNYYTEEARNYNNRHDFTINLGYSKKPAKWITLTFPLAGTYSFDSIGIICEPMKGYENKIAVLKEDTLQNIEISTNCISGNISLKQPKFLCLPVPYSAGWEAFVDGKKADLYKANIMYMALELDAGSHNILLKYHTPFLRAGTLVSSVSILFFGVYVWLSEFKRKKIKTGG